MASRMVEEPEVAAIKKKLFSSAMVGDWGEVVNIYKKDPRAHKARLTSACDTAVHIAVSDGQVKIVEQLVELIIEATAMNIDISAHSAREDTYSVQNLPRHIDHPDSVLDIAVSGGQKHFVKPLRVQATKADGPLYIENEQGNTPLHLAAMMGNAQMCRCIATADSHLAGCRNKDNENPIFTAVVHGQKDAFLWLHSICDDSKSYGYARGNDGDTILHAAIAGEYFDIAFQVIHLYPDLVNSVNGRGQSPLHLLATKPSAFSSGSHFNHLITFIYHCVFVEDLTVTPVPHSSAIPEDSKDPKDVTESLWPENYETCFAFLVLLWGLIRIPGVLLLNYLKRFKHTISCYPVKLPSKTFRSLVQNVSEVPVYCKRKIQHCTGVADVENPEDSKRCFPTHAKKGSIVPKDYTGPFPANYRVFFEYLKLISKCMLIVLGLGFRDIRKIRMKKEKHTWSAQILDKLLEDSIMYEYVEAEIPALSKQDSGVTNFYDMLPEMVDKRKQGIERMETPALIAAKNGITEIVEKILTRYPVAIHDLNSQKKNMVHLAVEHRQPHVYELLHKRKLLKDTVFGKLDCDGNSALHLAAMLRDYKPWNIPGAALQMQWELKWYEYVKYSMPLHFFVRYNKEGKTPKDIFTDKHKDLVQKGGEWLNSTSNSCSVVAALIATVAFATSATVPGGVNSENGEPTLEHQPAFNVFAVSSLVALCLSVTSVIMFLSILTSRHQEHDFGKGLPRKLLLGLTSLFVSIGAMLVSFCAGHFFVLRDELKYAAIPVYGVTCLPVTFFAVAQFPLYFDLLWATFRRLPQRSYKTIL